MSQGGLAERRERLFTVKAPQWFNPVIYSPRHHRVSRFSTPAPFPSEFPPKHGRGSDSEMGLNGSVDVCAAEYVGADKEKETKPDVVFLRAPVASGC